MLWYSQCSVCLIHFSQCFFNQYSILDVDCSFSLQKSIVFNNKSFIFKASIKCVFSWDSIKLRSLCCHRGQSRKLFSFNKFYNNWVFPEWLSLNSANSVYHDKIQEQNGHQRHSIPDNGYIPWCSAKKEFFATIYRLASVQSGEWQWIPVQS